MKRNGFVKLLVLPLAITLAFGATASIAAAKPKPGASCTTLGKKVTTGGYTYTCVKKGKKKVWSKGVAVPKPTPTPTPSGTPSATPTPTATPTPEPTSSGPTNPKDYRVPAEPSATALGTVITRTINADPTAPAFALKYVAKSESIGGEVSLVDQYSEAGGTYLANISMGIWGLKADDPGRYAWANLYSRSAMDGAKLPFPSPNRAKMYEIRIFPDGVFLYKIDRPIDLPYELADAAAYMKQLEMGSVPLREYDLKADGEWMKRSRDLADALDKLIPMAMADAKARHIGLQYIGHAGGGGGLLEGQIEGTDAYRLLAHLVELNGGKKLDFFDTATNCDEASTMTLDDMTPYFDYLVVSEFERGGYASNCNTSLMSCWFDLTNTAAVQFMVRNYFFASNISIKDSLYLELLYYRHAWYTERETIIPQSLTLVDSAAYLAKIPIIKKLVKENASMLGNIDDYKITSPTFGSDSLVHLHRDMGKVLDKISPTARQLMNEFVIGVVSTESLFDKKWDASGIYIYYFLLAKGFWF